MIFRLFSSPSPPFSFPNSFPSKALSSSSRPPDPFFFSSPRPGFDPFSNLILHAPPSAFAIVPLSIPPCCRGKPPLPFAGESFPHCHTPAPFRSTLSPQPLTTRNARAPQLKVGLPSNNRTQIETPVSQRTPHGYYLTPFFPLPFPHTRPFLPFPYSPPSRSPA